MPNLTSFKREPSEVGRRRPRSWNETAAVENPLEHPHRPARKTVRHNDAADTSIQTNTQGKALAFSHSLNHHLSQASVNDSVIHTTDFCSRTVARSHDMQLGPLASPITHSGLWRISCSMRRTHRGMIGAPIAIHTEVGEVAPLTQSKRYVAVPPVQVATERFHCVMLYRWRSITEVCSCTANSAPLWCAIVPPTHHHRGVQLFRQLITIVVCSCTANSSPSMCAVVPPTHHH